jgi:uncharacterized protein (DUF3084 family)
MNQERTMQFILENLAAVTASQQQAEVQIKGIRKLMLTGMKLIVRLEKGHRELQAEIKDLATQQKRTDQKIDRLLGSLKNGSNGRSGHKKR